MGVVGERPHADRAAPDPAALRSPGSGPTAAFSSTDPDETELRTEELLQCGHTMQLLEGDTPFRGRVEFARVDGCCLMASSYGAPVEVTCVPPIPWITVSFLSGGTAVFEQPGAEPVEVGAGRGGVLSYDRVVRMRWSPGVEQVMVAVRRDRVIDFLGRVLQADPRQPLRFQTALETAGDGRGVVAAASAMHRGLRLAGAAGPAPALAAELEHGLISALLLGQPHNYTEALFAPAPPPSSRVVDRVLELIESSPAAQLTVADLAAAAGVSARSLHDAFRRRHGASPMAYVRQHRLARARDELCRLGPDRTTVTAVALRHGFTHGGRFATAYRARYGESPSQTLRRS
ncbi:MAG: AraC family transcriptional regulator [Modestobacter sp.]|nr:AraC family transcriptional regulator [Modestobacter sp.]